MSTMEQILAETKKLIQIKRAEFSKKAQVGDEATKNPPESIGSMSPVDEEAKKPTPKQEESEEDRNVNEASNNTSGAGDDSEVTRGHASDATEPAESPEKKPEVSDDAQAKEASEWANDILASIRSYQKIQIAPEKKAEKKVEEKPAEKSVSKKVEKPAEEKAEKKADTSDKIELTDDILNKLAALMLAEKEGRDLAEKVMAKKAGEEAAKELVEFLEAKQAEEAYQAGAIQAQQDLIKAAYMQGLNDANVTKKAAVSNDPKSLQDLVKLGQAMADDALAQLMSQGPAAAGVPSDMSAGMPEDVSPVPEDIVSPEEDISGLGSESLDEEVTVEDVAAALDELVAADVIAPEDAEAVMSAVSETPGVEEVVEPATEEPVEAPAEEPVAEEPADKKSQIKKIQKLAELLASHVGAAKAKKIKK